jgi:hypothetical protein
VFNPWLIIFYLVSHPSAFSPLSIPQYTDVFNNCTKTMYVLELKLCGRRICVTDFCIGKFASAFAKRARRRRKPLSINDFGAGEGFPRRAAGKMPGEKYYLPPPGGHPARQVLRPNRMTVETPSMPGAAWTGVARSDEPQFRVNMRSVRPLSPNLILFPMVQNQRNSPSQKVFPLASTKKSIHAPLRISKQSSLL